LAANSEATAQRRQGKTLLLEGLDCPDCAKKLEERIRGLENVSEAAISFATGKLYIFFHGSLDGVYETITASGYRLATIDGDSEKWTLAKTRVIYAIISAAALAAALLLSRVSGTLSGVFLFIAVAVGGHATFRRGFNALKSRTFDINVLMTVAVAGALIIGEWWEAATVAFLFAASNALETYTAEKNRRSISALMNAAPQLAHRLREGAVETVSVDEVLAEEEIVIRPGERIPLDGTILSGSSFVTEAAITGESLPVAKQEGSTVYAGTLNGSGSLRVSVKGTAADTTLARIVRLVEEAQLRRAPFQQFIDRFARVYTPAVIGLAGAIIFGGLLIDAGDWHTWIYRGLALLIVACPCALVVSTPVSIAAALTNAARHGVLIKGGAYLEQAGLVRAMVFDKTGTLTTGRPAVVRVEAFEDFGKDDVVRAAASLEAYSEHLLAETVRAYAVELGLQLLPVDSFHAYPGKGVSGTVGNSAYFLGTEAFLAEKGVDMARAREISAGSETALYLASKENILGALLVRDTLRAEISLVLRRLRKMGIIRLSVLTGDRKGVAEAMAYGLELDDVFAELLPEEKEAMVQNFRQAYGKVAMVGDGINDAPALASADLGIAMGGAGNPTAMETADVTLMGDELEKIPFLLELSRRTISVIRQNIALSLLIKGLAILLVFPGWLTLWLAIVADMGASLLVTANGMRLLYFNDTDKPN
jgi:Cd2+/Zn2+-exporting ATPase